MSAGKHLGIRYRCVNAKHTVCAGTHHTIKDFFTSLPASEHAVLAIHDEDGVVGWFRYNIVQRAAGELLWAEGTWVSKDYRGRGVSHELWGRAMQKVDPIRVHVRTISPEGRALVGSVVRWFPEVEFLVLT